MRGFYSIWSKPYFENKSHEEFVLQDFELLTLVLSVAAYQKYNGRTRMFADRLALDYLKKNHLEELFLDGIYEMKVPSEIDPKVFWAAGKLCALEQMELPGVMIDLDLVIWKNLDSTLMQSDIAVIHREKINEEVYPGKDYFQMKQGYQFDPSWDWLERPANTALLYIKDMDFKNYYVKEALRFMQESEETTDNLCHMVFAEQRMLALCARKRNLSISSFFQHLWELDCQELFTHVWGHKNVLKYNHEQRHYYCIRCINRIKSEFKEVYPYIAQQADLQEYLKAIEEA